jgi:hypothetical protein
MLPIELSPGAFSSNRFLAAICHSTADLRPAPGRRNTNSACFAP